MSALRREECIATGMMYCDGNERASCGRIITVDHDNYWIDRNLTNNPLRREECIATVIISCDGNDPLRRIPVSAPAPCSSRCHEAFDKNTSRVGHGWPCSVCSSEENRKRQINGPQIGGVHCHRNNLRRVL
ncbi:hypothetical protein EMCRGX_G029766 [Ephydatia muelleri]